MSVVREVSRAALSVAPIVVTAITVVAVVAVDVVVAGAVIGNEFACAITQPVHIRIVKLASIQ